MQWQRQPREALAEWIERSSATQLAVLLGVSRQAVTAWATGRARPHWSLRQALEDRTGGTVRAAGWETPEEERERLRLQGVGR
jgi:DNA-binding XRE family transcriptional regulator